MKKPFHRCGGDTNTGGKCRRRVKKPGDRCRDHPRMHSPRNALKLCWRVIEKLTTAYAAYEAFQKVYPQVVEIVEKTGGILMPEDFWFNGFLNEDIDRMKLEIKRAKGQKAASLADRFKGYTDTDKERLITAYRKIEKCLDKIS